MYPYLNDYFFEKEISNYQILLVIAIITAVFVFSRLALKTKLNAGTYNFYLAAGVFSIPVGLFSAFFFQAIYHYAKNPSIPFKLEGMTVMGGIVGASVFFILFTLTVGNVPMWRKHKRGFWQAANLIIPGIVIAQSIGRIGCFVSGCCYGKETDGPFGITFIKGYLPNGNAVHHDHPRLPTQLFESVFMLVLFAVMLVLILKYKKKDIIVLLYLYAYPLFRFFIEFVRDDERGATFLGMSPSQIQSLCLLSVGITLTILIYRFGIVPFAGRKKTDANADETSVGTDSTETGSTKI